jgi:hypothetical protein
VYQSAQARCVDRMSVEAAAGHAQQGRHAVMALVCLLLAHLTGSALPGALAQIACRQGLAPMKIAAGLRQANLLNRNHAQSNASMQQTAAHAMAVSGRMR